MVLLSWDTCISFKCSHVSFIISFSTPIFKQYWLYFEQFTLKHLNVNVLFYWFLKSNDFWISIVNWNYWIFSHSNFMPYIKYSCSLDPDQPAWIILIKIYIVYLTHSNIQLTHMRKSTENILKISKNDSIITVKSWDHCDKRRNCFSKVFYCRVVYMRLYFT